MRVCVWGGGVPDGGRVHCQAPVNIDADGNVWASTFSNKLIIRLQVETHALELK